MFSSPRSKAKLAQRSFQRSGPPDRSRIDRINEVTAAARSIWFGLLSFLAFVSLSFVGVEDKDFFLKDRETSLPLVGVDVPTLVFFAVTPFLGFLLYAYFHMHLDNLWKALADAPERFGDKRLSDLVRPWLVTDVALSYRSDDALRPRPLARWAHWINLTIAFAGTPIVLAGFWYRSFPPHIDWLTLGACGLPLSATIYVGWTSWTRMRAMARRDTGVGRQRRIVQLSAIVALVILGVGWLRVEGTFANYLKALGVEEDWLETHALGQTFMPDLLYPANLEGVTFASLPDGWEDRDGFRVSYRATWCAGRGLAPAVCGPAPEAEAEAEARSPSLETFLLAPLLAPDLIQEESEVDETLAAARQAWCNDLIVRSQSKEFDCVNAFERLEAEYERDWLAMREADLRNLTSFNLIGADLRNARLQSAQLQGADLFGAQLQGANLFGAQLQGAGLWQAQLQGAILWQAQLQGANLEGAQLQGAALRGAQLQGANLEGAQLQGAGLIDAQLQRAILWQAQLQGAGLEGAQLQGANLFGAQLQRANLEGAQLQGAGLIDAQLQRANLEGAQLQGAILFGAQLQRANLEGAQLQGADLRRALLDDATDLRDATLRGASLRSVDDTSIAQLEPFWEDIFADGTVQVPEGKRPGHWAKEKLGVRAFHEAWRAWQRSIGQDPGKPE